MKSFPVAILYLWVAAVAAIDLWHFVKSIPDEAQAEMHQIIDNKNLTKAQVMERLDVWAAKQPEGFQEEYEQVKNLLATRGLNAYKAQRNPTVNPAIDEIRQNTSLTREQEREAVQKILTVPGGIVTTTSSPIV
ncbi:unnamed protein product [Bursaphelenchus xylophilus]|uniref:(pine wood nematode) hypothetical protein n=1 Tax=Bursaphelenchus xylophilus TaxID=6326 RepID=A0A1I7RQX4_BURXY|nr:unnamed protein product [Bursaphelenchus xylophilus]CAG9130729.1 unnamed protein product [Bursaphelenchus xylophilus]